MLIFAGISAISNIDGDEGASGEFQDQERWSAPPLETRNIWSPVEISTVRVTLTNT